MKKKKAKKKGKPTSKKSTARSKTVPIRDLTECEKRARLYQKIELVRKALPEIEATGCEKDPETQEEINYTEAHIVIEKYQEQFNAVGLVVRPCDERPDIHINGGVVIVTMFFEIADTTTGYCLRGPGIGMGANRDWSGNTAQTRALKQFLLTSFGAFWRDPEQARKMEAKMVRQEVAEQLGPGLKNAVDDLKNYFDQMFQQKGKVNDGAKH